MPRTLRSTSSARSKAETAPKHLKFTDDDGSPVASTSLQTQERLSSLNDAAPDISDDDDDEDAPPETVFSARNRSIEEARAEADAAASALAKEQRKEANRARDARLKQAAAASKKRRLVTQDVDAVSTKASRSRKSEQLDPSLFAAAAKAHEAARQSKQAIQAKQRRQQKIKAVDRKPQPPLLRPDARQVGDIRVQHLPDDPSLNRPLAGSSLPPKQAENFVRNRLFSRKSLLSSRAKTSASKSARVGGTGRQRKHAHIAISRGTRGPARQFARVV
ncbi:uncharacterized protein L969DRAFT_97429 [Mixia osmundae IAM 14324]|uniref:Uncharacterized protein n=1 Tax=Mixia osmundae (strain CBS 9802 / IAM 14324 / JCM 22182 / KY 12970) TaxID=764103 RepID=G7DUI7_MIXOS|nr:uncharacterized protein L969DRAFT_97429 [Mixia osmundae IAM 14324]KEI36418.1 hypothetical protein L969DRAFT_97429 [Mixia osmundae IAM 14324]GAA94247.1 hypothetical protein E5Q_00896 [Mixia osmundae IAM 14324]